MYELNNERRAHFGLKPVQEGWERVIFAGDKHRPASVLYFDGDVIKKHVVSTDEIYAENDYDEATRGREALLPKTAKGKEAKLTPANFQKRTPLGVYLSVYKQWLTLANHTSQTTFYDSSWEQGYSQTRDVKERIEDFIAGADADHFRKIEEFKRAKRKNVKFKSGDYFRFKLDRNRYGFGRVVLDVHKLRCSGLLPADHALLKYMGRPVMAQLFVHASLEKADVRELLARARLPMDVMMDNALFYGEFEIFAHEKIDPTELDFPISFHISPARTYLQWGFIQLAADERSVRKAASWQLAELIGQNNFQYNSIGISPHYAQFEIAKALRGEDIFSSKAYAINKDLRNPKWRAAKDELMRIFGLDPSKSYLQNAQMLGVKTVLEF